MRAVLGLLRILVPGEENDKPGEGAIMRESMA